MKQRLQELLQRYNELAPRERRMVALAAAVVLVTILYLVIWEPLAQARQARAEALAQAREVAQQLEVAAASAAANRGGNTPVQGRGQSLLTVVDQAARASTLGKPLSRLQPDGDTKVRAWIEDVPFDGLLRWLADLQTRYGISIENAEIEARGNGTVSARLSLERKA